MIVLLKPNKFAHKFSIIECIGLVIVRFQVRCSLAAAVLVTPVYVAYCLKKVQWIFICRREKREIYFLYRKSIYKIQDNLTKHTINKYNDFLMKGSEKTMCPA